MPEPRTGIRSWRSQTGCITVIGKVCVQHLWATASHLRLIGYAISDTKLSGNRPKGGTKQRRWSTTADPVEGSAREDTADVGLGCNIMVEFA
jgi:hypothetical protein